MSDQIVIYSAMFYRHKGGEFYMNEELLVWLCWGEADVLVSAAGGLLQLQLNVNTHFLHVHFCFKTFPGNIF